MGKGVVTYGGSAGVKRFCAMHEPGIFRGLVAHSPKQTP